MNYPKTILWSGVIAAFAFTGAAYAQDTSVDKDATQAKKADVAKMDTAPSHNLLAYNDAAPQTDAADQNDEGAVQQLGTIQASGLAFSMKQSLATEKNATGIVNAITATDIGSLPATNVAEALRHVPGVTIDNNFPIQQRVSIDGISPNLILTLLNGHGISQTRWFYANSPNRGFNYSMLPTELVGSIEIHKSYEASQPAGGLGGTIIVHTLNPLDTKANTIAGSVGVLYNAQSKNTDPNASVVYSTHNDEGTFGFNVALSHFENDYVREGREEFNAPYPSLGDIAPAGSPLEGLINSGKVNGDWQLPAEVNRAHFAQDEKRDSAFVSFEVKPTDAFSAGVNLLYLQNGASNYNTSMYPAEAPFSPGYIDAITAPSPGSNIVQGGHVAGVACTAKDYNAGNCANPLTTQEDFNARDSKIKTEGADVHIAYDGDSWGFSGRAGFNDSTNTANGEYASNATYTGGYTWDTYKGWTWDNPDAATNPEYWATSTGPSFTRQPTKQRQNYVQLNFSVDFDSAINKIEFGARYHNTWVSQLRYAYTNVLVQPGSMAAVPVDTMDMDSWDALNDWKHAIAPADKAAVKQLVLNSPAQPGNQNVQDLLDSNTFNPAAVQAGSYGVKQTDEEAFVQADFTNNDNLKGNFGARFVHIKNNMTNPADVAAGETWDGTWTSSTGTSDTVLPAFNIAYSPSDHVVLRGAMSETLAFIGFGSLNNATFLNDDTLDGTAGNTDLKPYRSVNTMLSAAWYFTPESVLSVDLFNRNIINYIHDGTTVQKRQNLSWDTINRSPFLLKNCDSSGLCDYKITSPINGGAGRVTGFTAAYEQAFGDSGFGLKASYTFADGKNSEGGDLPYNSKDTYTVSPFYSKGPINASITYTWRSPYQANGYIAGAAVTEIGEYQGLDAQFSFSFTDYLTLQLSGNNLTNTKFTSYYGGNKDQAANDYYNGTVYEAKLRFKF